MPNQNGFWQGEDHQLRCMKVCSFKRPSGMARENWSLEAEGQLYWPDARCPVGFICWKRSPWQTMELSWSMTLQTTYSIWVCQLNNYFGWCLASGSNSLFKLVRITFWLELAQSRRTEMAVEIQLISTCSDPDVNCSTAVEQLRFCFSYKVSKPKNSYYEPVNRWKNIMYLWWHKATTAWLQLQAVVALCQDYCNWWPYLSVHYLHFNNSFYCKRVKTFTASLMVMLSFDMYLVGVSNPQFC